ncbi:MAG TPA: hypothetical protein VGR97_11620 [Candidatus Acidoferrales bacterium]|nr:hypothetical protein [Candidatus Acidoferrales bacterium]
MIKSKVSNYLPLVTLILLAVWIIVSRLKNLSHPPVGTFIGVLAFVAAVVTILPPDSSWSKATWLIVFGGFLVLEITTLYQQRVDDLQTDREKTTQENNRFAGLLKTQQDHFADVLKQNQREFSTTMGEVKGSPGYVWFVALARTAGDLPVMMGNDNKVPIRGVDLEIVSIPPKGSLNELNQIANNVFNPRLVHIGDVSPGFQQAPFTLAPGKYDIRIITRLAVFNEHLEVIRGSSVPHGWLETFCVLKNNSSKVVRGECPKAP